MDEVSQPLDPKQVGLLSHDKADGVHEVGLARPIGANHCHERLERTNLLVASIGFEVVHLDEIDVANITIQLNIMEQACQLKIGKIRLTQPNLNELELNIFKGGRHGNVGLPWSTVKLNAL